MLTFFSCSLSLSTTISNFPCGKGQLSLKSTTFRSTFFFMTRRRLLLTLLLLLASILFVFDSLCPIFREISPVISPIFSFVVKLQVIESLYWDRLSRSNIFCSILIKPDRWSNLKIEFWSEIEMSWFSYVYIFLFSESLKAGQVDVFLTHAL